MMVIVLKVTITFRGREMAHRDIGLDILNKFSQMVSAKFETEPSMNGRNMVVILTKPKEAQQ
jgi:translation initiation factor IF-3